MIEAATPLFSVVIPSYNHGRYIGRALQSVMDQTYFNWEVIVIDNHSTDNTDEVISSFADSRIGYLKIHNNGVIAVSRNAGIRVAKGVWIAFLDSDDWWTNDKLQVCFERINDNVDLVYHDLETVNNKHGKVERSTQRTRQVMPPVIMDLLLNGNAISNSSAIVRKTIIDKIGGINEKKEMTASEDFNTWVRISRISEQFIYIPKTLGFYLAHESNISNKEDMSLNMECAFSEFMHLLTSSQQNRINANFCYMRGRQAYCKNDHPNAIKNLRFVARHGRIMYVIKSIYMIANISIKRCFKTKQ